MIDRARIKMSPNDEEDTMTVATDADVLATCPIAWTIRDARGLLTSSSTSQPAKGGILQEWTALLPGGHWITWSEVYFPE